ncbi:hypothetical protein ThrDRAFT_04772 [Frankia casuarinae]|jgi:hypothetical protein|uniref:DUF6875 domain-containing protein n=1 Tax=Frankia casuarinae (strain DSM 45818 / CECT 9043 / HFP020203 / CcI3) TaxID=106370 RepID=Q2J5U0_FRACC|nr:hypothetical protein [Frankia casuarinae]ABD13352.1 hypothetical protein Francci3_4002 [Frankia casuarinae]EYT89611.1 hypothetical protein ThrDRAFT_04772 [Frankia casuarinae]
MSDDHTAEKTVNSWFRSYLARPHPMLGRLGAVCPYVRPALDGDQIRLWTLDLPKPIFASWLEDRVREAIRLFPALFWQPELSLPALVLAFPDMGEQDWPLIDQVHSIVKSEAVSLGLMIGQFHGSCTEPSARNQDFHVNVSPVPLFAIRRMSVHDILFLHSRPDWFAVYRDRFGDHYRGERTQTGILAELYSAAEERFFGTPLCPA